MPTSPVPHKKIRKKHRYRWVRFLLGFLAIIIIAIVAYFVWIATTISNSQSYVSNWSQLNSSANAKTSNVAGSNYAIIAKTQKDPNVTNILLIGNDGEGRKIGYRSDCMMVMSLNSSTKTVRLVSLLRDIRAYDPYKGTWDKLNAAYSYGGPGQTVNIINEDFGLDIQKYIVVDFTGFESIVSAVGGVTLKITSREATQIPGMHGKPAGTYHLTGHQALMYSRIRHIDSDFYRVQRQRNVLMAIYNKLKSADITKKVSTANTFIQYIKTNMSATDILSMVTTYGSAISGVQQLTIPETGMWSNLRLNNIDYISINNWNSLRSTLSNYLYSYSASDSTSSS